MAIQQHYTDAERTDFTTFISQLETLLRPKLRNLSEEENQRFGVIDEDNKLFVNKVNDYNKNNPVLSSPDVDWVEFDADFVDRSFLENAALRLEGLMKAMTETRRVHDYDNFEAALRDYRYAQYKDSTTVGEGYDVKVRELGQFFKKGGSSETDVPE